MLEATHIVIGAGSAGAALAYRLSEDPDARVLILEAGGSDAGPFIQMPAALSYQMNMSRYDWGFVSDPEPHLGGRQLVTPRGKVVGGSSSINGMVYVRGHARDFDTWSEMGAQGWSYADVAPYFERMETAHGGEAGVRGTSGPMHVTRGTKWSPLYNAFIEAGRDLVRDGADGITTNCGFLSLFQAELSDALRVPVATSSLMQVDLVNRLLPPGRKAGILTISASTLTPRHLAAAGVPESTPVGSTEGGREFTRAILGNELELDVELARQDNIEAALALCASHPDIGALVLECTNMVPYAADIRAATGVPVFSIETFVSWFQSSLVPRRY